MREFIQPPQILTPERRRWNPFAHLSGILGTLAILLGILYAGLLMISRTAGFADIVRGQLEKHTGLEFKVGHSALTPSFALVLEDVQGSVPKHPLKARVEAKRVVIVWKLSGALGGGDPLRELRAEKCDLHFGLDSAGRWQPAQFAQVSEWLAGKMQMDLKRYTAYATSATTNTTVDEFDLFAEPHIEMRDALVHWSVVADSEIARADGVNLASTRVRLPGRDITHFVLSMRKADTAQGFHAIDSRMELIEFNGREIWLEGGPTNAAAPAARPATKLAEPRRPQPATVTNAARAMVRTQTNAVEKPAPPPQPLPAGSPDPKPEE